MEFPANRPSKDETLGLFAGLPRRYDLAGAVLSFGQDPRWRRAMVGQVGAHLIPTFGWRPMFVIAGIGALVVWYLRKRLPESPRWLEARGRTADAEALLQTIERDEAGDEQEKPSHQFSRSRDDRPRRFELRGLQRKP